MGAFTECFSSSTLLTTLQNERFSCFGAAARCTGAQRGSDVVHGCIGVDRSAVSFDPSTVVWTPALGAQLRPQFHVIVCHLITFHGVVRGSGDFPGTPIGTPSAESAPHICRDLSNAAGVFFIAKIQSHGYKRVIVSGPAFSSSFSIMSETPEDTPKSKPEGDGLSISTHEEASDPYLVTFDGVDDKEDVITLPNYQKWGIVIIVSMTSLCVTCISSVWSLASAKIMKEFGISHEISSLGIALYIWGLGIGGIFLSPISEFHGRKVVYVSGLLLTICFEFLTAFCRNIGGMLFGRFAAGFFASAFMSVASGSFSDLFRNTDRNVDDPVDQDKELARALVLYSVSPFIGPGLGPCILGAIANQDISFRWTFIVLIIWSSIMCIIVFFFIPETYEPELLKRKAKRIRKETGDTRYYAPIEITKITLYDSVLTSSKRPMLLIFRDQMTLALCFYTAFTLSIVYMFFVAFPYIFTTVYHFNPREVGMSFIGLIVGFALTSLSTPLIVERIRHRLIRKSGEETPELNLIALMIGVFIVPIGLFIMAWTSYSSIHWIVPIIGSGIYAGGTILVFSGIFSYQITAYRTYAASAMSTNSLVRSLLAGGFVLFGLQMYKGMGIHWATSLLAFFALVLIPVPFLFYKYGAAIRRRSSYAWS